MPWSGSSFTLNQNFPADRDAGAPDHFIDADKVDNELQNIKGGLEALLLRDGSNSPSADINWNTKKITNLAAPASDNDAARQAEIKMMLGKMPSAAEFIISGGSITPTQAVFTIDTQSSASTDDLDTINAANFSAGDLVLVAAANTARTVVLRDNQGNIQNVNNENLSLDTTEKYVLYRYDGTNWQEVVRSTGLLGSAALLNTGTGGANLGLLNASWTQSGTNTWSGPNTFTAGTAITIDATGGQGLIEVGSDVDSANVGAITFYGHDSGGSNTNYGRVRAQADVNTAGSEDGSLDFMTIQNGGFANKVTIALGLFTHGAGGGDQGLNTINASAIYDDGTGPLTDYVFEKYTTGAIDIKEYDELAYKEKHEAARDFMSSARCDWVYDLDEFAAFWKRNHHFPNWPGKTLDYKMPLGEQIQKLVEVCETQAVHIEKLNQCLKALKADQRI